MKLRPLRSRYLAPVPVGSIIGAFTNLTHDHLDFHHTMDEYFRVKMTLFTHVLPSGSFAVLNADSDWFPRAEAIGEDEHSASPYESQDTFNEYMTLHFGDANLQMPFESGPKAATLFPQRCAELLIDWCKKFAKISIINSFATE